jgi:hypothetical protein
MASSKFSLDNFAMRFAAAMLLVFATFNPLQPYSYFHWAVSPLFGDFGSFTLVKGLVGIILIIGWSIFLRATFRSLGMFGILLAGTFFGLLVWLIIDLGWIGSENSDAIAWLTLLGFSGVLSVGISWSHIRRRMTGQLDVDETDD